MGLLRAPSMMHGAIRHTPHGWIPRHKSAFDSASSRRSKRGGKGDEAARRAKQEVGTKSYESLARRHRMTSSPIFRVVCESHRMTCEVPSSERVGYGSPGLGTTAASFHQHASNEKVFAVWSITSCLSIVGLM